MYRISFFLTQLHVADQEENNPSVPNFQNNNSQTVAHPGQLSAIRNEEKERCSFLDKQTHIFIFLALEMILLLGVAVLWLLTILVCVTHLVAVIKKRRAID